MIAKGIRRRQQILEIARAHFFRFGFDRTNLADVASEVGIRPSALYHYFADKTALFTEAFQSVWGDQMERIEGRCDEITDPVERIVCFSNGLIAYVHEVLTEQGVPVFVYLEALSRLAHVFADLDREKRAYIARALAELPGIDDPSEAADELVDARNALEHEILRGWTPEEVDFTALIARTERLVRVYVAGLRAMGGEP